MKKSLKTIVLLSLTLLFVSSLASCVTINFGDKFLAKDEEYHWYVLANGEIEDKVAHEYTIESHIALNPTCENKGIAVYKCICGETTQVAIPALGHTANEEVISGEDSHWNECHCGEKLNVEKHNYINEGKVLTESTCITHGSMEIICECGAVSTKELELGDHVIGEELKNDDTTCWKECTLCQEKFDVKEHEYVIPQEVVTAPTCKEEGVQKFACECGKTSEMTIPSLGGHIDEDNDIICDREGCTYKVLPLNNSTIGLFVANQIGALISTSNTYYVEGVVSQVLDAKNGIFYIQDETGEEFYFRLPKDENGTSHANWESKIVLGDTVKLYGKINKFTSGTTSIPAMQNPTVVERIHEHNFSLATCTKLSTCECGQEQGELLPHEDLDLNDLCDDCGFNLKYKLFETPINTLDNDPNSGVLTGTATRTWNYDVFTLVVDKGSASSIYTTKDKYMKLKSSNTVTVTANGDYKFHQIQFVSTTSSYATALEASIKTVSGVTVEIVDSVIVVVTFNEDATSLSFKLTKTSRFSDIIVIY